MRGATGAELREAYSLASLTTRYSAMMHARQYDLDQFEAEFDRIADHLQAGAADD